MSMLEGEWRTVRSNLWLICFAWIGLLVVSVISTLLVAVTIETHSERAYDLLDVYAKIFTTMNAAGLLVVLFGLVGLVRLRPAPLAVLAAVGCACLVAFGLAQLSVLIVDDRAELLQTLSSKPIYMGALGVGVLTTTLLLLSASAAGGRAGRPGPLLLIALGCLAAAFVWSAYLRLAQPDWDFLLGHPWWSRLLYRGPGWITSALVAAQLATLASPSCRPAAPSGS